MYQHPSVTNAVTTAAIVIISAAATRYHRYVRQLNLATQLPVAVIARSHVFTANRCC
jgi:hypothetical protein